MAPRHTVTRGIKRESTSAGRLLALHFEPDRRPDPATTRLSGESPDPRAPKLSKMRGAVKGASMLLVRVQPEELSVHLGSYLGGGEGDRPVEAPGTKVREGGLASVRAATRVKPEQASKGRMRAPSRPYFGEGRRGWSEQPTDEDRSARRGNGRGTHTRIGAQHGRPAAVRGSGAQPSSGDGPRQESEGPIVPSKPVNAGGGNGPWFGTCPDEPRGGGLA
jgi:hypothetical protein